MKEKIEDILNSYILDDLPSGMVSELTTLIQEERKKAVEEKEKWLGFYRSDILSGFIPKCSCGKKADVQTERGKYAQENLHRPSNWGWYCNKCFEKGLREEEEAMGYYDKEYLESEGKE
jgi:hypothetical protein